MIFVFLFLDEVEDEFFQDQVQQQSHHINIDNTIQQNQQSQSDDIAQLIVNFYIKWLVDYSKG